MVTVRQNTGMERGRESLPECGGQWAWHDGGTSRASVYRYGHVPSRRGSGIGVKNVNERIHLYFGKNYGLSIELGAR